MDSLYERIRQKSEFDNRVFEQYKNDKAVRVVGNIRFFNKRKEKRGIEVFEKEFQN